MATCPSCFKPVAFANPACPTCGTVFGSENGLRPLAQPGEREELRATIKLRLFVLLVALLPIPLSFLGSLLTHLLSCASSPDRIHSCKVFPAAESTVTFLAIYCGWAIVFWVPVGLLVLLALSLFKRK
jgi:hypothetical protein